MGEDKLLKLQFLFTSSGFLLSFPTLQRAIGSDKTSAKDGSAILNTEEAYPDSVFGS